MMGTACDILCTACGAETLLRRSPRYEGFSKVGETLTCASCGFEYAREEDVPFKQKKAPAVFDASDAPPKLTVFREEEKGRLCRYCTSYVVNPFAQRCVRRRREVEATDTCPDFDPKSAP